MLSPIARADLQAFAMFLVSMVAFRMVLMASYTAHMAISNTSAPSLTGPAIQLCSSFEELHDKTCAVKIQA